MLRIFAGVDPGYEGGVAFIVSESEAHVFDVPLYGDVKGKHGDYDLPAMRDLLVQALTASDGGLVYGVVESPLAFSAQGIASTAKAARGSALWEGLGIGLDISMRTVRPGDWKRQMGLTKDKDDSLTMARALFPALADQLKRKKDNGRAEAILLAEWLRRQHEGDA